MRTQGHLTDQELVDIVDGYTNKLLSMITLAAQYGITRQGVFKVLQRAGIDTSRAVAWLTVSCTCCGKAFLKRRCQIRKQKHVFCCEKCYYAWLQHGNGNPLVVHRQGLRIARDVVSKYHTLLPGELVHHEDRNQNNNHISNLIVFTGQGDHIRYHRGFIVPVLFDGRTIKT